MAARSWRGSESPRERPLDSAGPGCRPAGDGAKRGSRKVQRVARLLLSRGASWARFGRRAGRRGVGPRPACGRRAHRHQRIIWVTASVNSGGLLSIAVSHDRPGMLALLLDLGLDPNERIRVERNGRDPLLLGRSLVLLRHKGQAADGGNAIGQGADPNANVYTSGSPLFRAYSQKDWDFVRLLEQHGGLLDAVSAGFACQTGRPGSYLPMKLPGACARARWLPGSTVSEDLLWTACGGGDPEIVRLALERIDWPRQDSRWLGSLWQAFTCDGEWSAVLPASAWCSTGPTPTTAIPAKRCCTLSWREARQKHVPFAEMLLDQGARIDIRDELLQSTALGWACRWGRVHFVKLLLERGADPVETDAEPWATPRAWAQKMKHDNVLQVLRKLPPKVRKPLTREKLRSVHQ